MFGKLFGSKSNKSNANTSTPDAQTAILQLREAVAQLEKREAHLQSKMAVCLYAAKLKTKQHDNATLCSKRRSIWNFKLWLWRMH